MSKERMTAGDIIAEYEEAFKDAKGGVKDFQNWLIDKLIESRHQPKQTEVDLEQALLSFREYLIDRHPYVIIHLSKRAITDYLNNQNEKDQL